MHRRTPFAFINARFNDSGRLYDRVGHVLALHDGGGTGGDGGDGKPKVDDPDTIAEFKALLKELKGSDGKGINAREEHLLSENFKMRDRLRRQKAEIEKAKLADGARVLSKDEAAVFDGFTKLKVKPEDLTTLLTEHSTLKEEKARAEADKHVATIADALGMNSRALKRFAAAEGLTLVLKEVKVRDPETKDVTVEEHVFARKRGAKADGSEDEPLDEMLERDFSEDIDLLYAEPAQRQQQGDAEGPYREDASTRRTRVTRDGNSESGTRFPRQSTAAPTGASRDRKALEDATIKKRNSGMYS